MRVFVTGTGRCGSVSFWHACAYITNFTSAHESPCGLLHYPDRHIEINPQIRYVIKPLADKFPDAIWVHLRRERGACATSLARLNGGNWLNHFGDLCGTIMPSSNATLRALRIYDHLIDQIETTLAAHVPAENRIDVELWRAPDVPDGFDAFWERIGAEGDLAKARESWKTPHNTSEDRGDA